MKSFIVILVISTVLLAANFTDDFDSYTPGSNLSSSPYWFSSDSSGSLIIAEDGSNRIAQTVWNGNKFVGYVCMGAGVWADGTIGCDVKFTGSQAAFALMSRINGFSSESYIAGMFAMIPPVGSTFIAYVDSTGGYNILAQDYFYPLNEDTWYSLNLEISGSDSVDISLSVNNSVNSHFVFTEYVLPAGLSGVAAGFDSTHVPLFSIDNFEVTDNIQSFTTTTFGGIKAIFR